MTALHPEFERQTAKPRRSTVKTIKSLALLCCLVLGACAQQSDTAGGDDVVDPTDPGQDPNPDPDAECQTASDCTDDVACATPVCDHGTCSYEPRCVGEEVCDEDHDTCETPATTLPAGHQI